jgi:hypothetical protein
LEKFGSLGLTDTQIPMEKKYFFDDKKMYPVIACPWSWCQQFKLTDPELFKILAKLTYKYVVMVANKEDKIETFDIDAIDEVEDLGSQK